MWSVILPLLVLTGVARAEDPLASAAEVPSQAAPADEAPAPQSRTWRVDPKRSALWVTVFNDQATLASRFAHDHAIAALDYDGRITWDLADASACRVRFELPVTSLWPDPPGFRERAGIDPEDTVSENAKKQIVRNMLGNSQLASGRFPTITFESTSCSATSGEVDVTGDLAIRGVTKRITVPMQVSVDGDAFRAKGRFQLEHRDFGFEPFTNLGGAIRFQQKLEFGIDVVASPVE